jgi:hypothetical protein
MITDPTFNTRIARIVNNINGRTRFRVRPCTWSFLRCFLSRDRPVAAATGTAAQQMHITYLLGIRATGFAQAKDLKPMALNLKTSRFGNRIEEWIKLVAFEQNRLATMSADNQVLVTVPCPDESLAVLGLVDTLDKTQIFELLQCAIDRHQPDVRILLTGSVVNLHRSQRSLAGLHHVHHNAPRARQAAAG